MSLQRGQLALNLLGTEVTTENAYADDRTHYVAFYSDARGYVSWRCAGVGASGHRDLLSPPCLSPTGSGSTWTTRCRTPQPAPGPAGGSGGRTGSRSSTSGVHRSQVPSATSRAASGMSSSSGEQQCATSRGQRSAPAQLAR